MILFIQKNCHYSNLLIKLIKKLKLNCNIIENLENYPNIKSTPTLIIDNQTFIGKKAFKYLLEKYNNNININNNINNKNIINKNIINNEYLNINEKINQMIKLRELQLNENFK